MLRGWSYAEISSTPLDLARLCAEFGWNKTMLREVPLDVLRDFAVIAEVEREANANHRR